MAKQTTQQGFLLGTKTGAWWLWTAVFTFDSIHSQVQSLLYLLHDKVLKCNTLECPPSGKLPLLSLNSPSLPSEAFPSPPAHWKMSAGPASLKDDMSCMHPQASH